MPSGECIQLDSTVSFVFECTSLAHASPATVSRCGLLALTQPRLGAVTQHAWLATLPEEQQGAQPLLFFSTHTCQCPQGRCATGASTGCPRRTPLHSARVHHTWTMCCYFAMWLAMCRGRPVSGRLCRGWRGQCGP